MLPAISLPQALQRGRVAAHLAHMPDSRSSFPAGEGNPQTVQRAAEWKQRSQYDSLPSAVRKY
jgi:hypothetical protein